MVFIRRKSVAAADGEESRPRNRLSKPMTGKSPPSQKSVAGKHSPRSGSQSVSSSSSRMSLADMSKMSSKKEFGPQQQAHPLVVEDIMATKPIFANVPKRKNGVASLVMQFESVASASQTSLTLPPPPLPPKSSFTSYATNRTTDIQQEQAMQSKEQLKLHRKSMSTVATPNESVEQVVDSVAIPQRRPSTYRPGQATRKSNTDDKTMPSSVAEEKPKIDMNKPLPTVTQELQREAIHEQWSSQPPIVRTETPSSLQAIGPLRLGSLHIVNGRTSPVLSELSKHLISRHLRDVSSEYADSTYSKDITGEDWEDAAVADEAEETETEEPKTPIRTTFEDDARQFTTPTPKDNNLEAPVTPMFQTPARTPDKASVIAEAYRNEIQGSPFSYGSVSPIPSGSIVHSQMNKEQISDSEKSEPDTPVSRLTSDPVKPTPKPLDKQANLGDHWGICQDVTVADSARSKGGLCDRTMSLQSEQPSIESKPSVTDTERTRELIFSSALEYQAPSFHPPPSPERGISPDSLHPPSIGACCDKVDSGYNSGNSMLSLELVDHTSPIQTAPLHIFTAQIDQPLQEQALKPSTPKKEGSPRKFGRFFPSRSPNRKSISKMPDPVPSVPEPRAIMNTPEKKTESPVKMMKKDKEEREKAAKVQKKLQKSRPTSMVRGAQEIVVQRLPSCESTLDVPAISDSARMNLNFRTQQVPELERTFRSQEDIKIQPSMSNLALALPAVDIRFPSPMPVDDEDERSSRSARKERGRSKSRPRSKSRRRSFLDMFKSEKGSRNRSADVKNEGNDLSIADFGDVVASLGSNPYDIAHSQPTSRQPETPDQVFSAPKTNPHNISVNRPQQRSSMSAEEASEFARMRSHSFNGHDEKGDRKPNFNEKGNILSNFRRTSVVLADDAPPVPPLPNKEELKRISQRYSMQSQYLSTPTESKKFWEASPNSDRHIGNGSAQASPSRSPMPDHEVYNDEDDFAVEEQMEVVSRRSHSPAPFDTPTTPPRSHSPLPGDVEYDESPWEAQARVWKARRQSAGEALRSHRESLDLRGGEYQNNEPETIEFEEDLPYPEIPPRHPGRNTATPPEERWPFDSNDYGHQSQQSPLRHSQTWDSNGYEPYDQGYGNYTINAYHRGQPRHNTWHEGQENIVHDQSFDRSYDQFSHNVRPNLRTQNSNNSQQSFYSHHNGQIDRPFDLPPRFSADLDDDYDDYDQEDISRSSPFRGRLPVRQNFDVYNGYENHFQPQYQDNGSYNYYNDRYDDHNGGLPQRQMIPQHPRFCAPSSYRSQHGSFVEPSLIASRPNTSLSQTSAPSHRSHMSFDIPNEGLKPQHIRRRPVPVPDYGR